MLFSDLFLIYILRLVLLINRVDITVDRIVFTCQVTEFFTKNRHVMCIYGLIYVDS